jgi:hypothetical protein
MTVRAARDPHLDPPPFRGRNESAVLSELEETFLANGLLFSPPARGRDRVGVY